MEDLRESFGFEDGLTELDSLTHTETSTGGFRKESGETTCAKE